MASAARLDALSKNEVGIWHPRRGWMQPTAGIGWLSPQMQAQTPLTLRSPEPINSTHRFGKRDKNAYGSPAGICQCRKL